MIFFSPYREKYVTRAEHEELRSILTALSSVVPPATFQAIQQSVRTTGASAISEAPVSAQAQAQAQAASASGASPSSSSSAAIPPPPLPPPPPHFSSSVHSPHILPPISPESNQRLLALELHCRELEIRLSELTNGYQDLSTVYREFQAQYRDMHGGYVELRGEYLAMGRSFQQLREMHSVLDARLRAIEGELRAGEGGDTRRRSRSAEHGVLGTDVVSRTSVDAGGFSPRVSREVRARMKRGRDIADADADADMGEGVGVGVGEAEGADEFARPNTSDQVPKRRQLSVVSRSSAADLPVGASVSRRSRSRSTDSARSERKIREGRSGARIHGGGFSGGGGERDSSSTRGGDEVPSSSTRSEMVVDEYDESARPEAQVPSDKVRTSLFSNQKDYH